MSRARSRRRSCGTPDPATGLVSIALAVLFIRPDIGAAPLATVFGLFSIFYGVSAVVLSLQARNVRSTAQRLLNTPA